MRKGLQRDDITDMVLKLFQGEGTRRPSPWGGIDLEELGHIESCVDFALTAMETTGWNRCRKVKQRSDMAKKHTVWQCDWSGASRKREVIQ